MNRGVLLVVGFALVVGVMASAGGSDNPRALYLCALLAICTSTLWRPRPLNGRYGLLIVFHALYFVFYGVSDLFALLPSLHVAAPPISKGLLSATEIGVLLGAVLLTLGYRFALSLARGSRAALGAKDWRPAATIIGGLALWLLGLASTWFWASNMVERYGAPADLGPYETIALLIGRMVQPLGVALLAYRLVRTRSGPLLLLVTGVLCVEFVFGFIADSKELAVRGVLLVLLAKYFLDGKVPFAWLTTAAVVFVLSFAVFQSYRFEILQTRHQTRTAAAQNLSKNLDKALDSDKLERGYVASGLAGLVERTSLKPTLEVVIHRVGRDVAYQSGATIVTVFGAFIPRVLWPTKPDNAAGQLFNREFEVSADRNTYISSTHLGELYWNFGWPGIVVGMFVIGTLLGFIGGRFSLAEHASLTRFLVVATTFYLLCVRFEGGIAMAYTLWIRSLALIFLMHLVLARVAPRRRSQAKAVEPPTNCHPAPS